MRDPTEVDPHDVWLTRAELREIMRVFIKCGYKVRYLEESNFEFIVEDYPTHVNATPYFLQFTSVIIVPTRNRRARASTLRDEFLNAANQGSHLAKITCNSSAVDPGLGAWRLKVEAKLMMGIIRPKYKAKPLERFVTLWLHDIANIMLLKQSFRAGIFRTKS